MEEIKLKPCPFCGNKVMLHAVEYERSLWIVTCNGCQMEMTVKRCMKGRDYMSNHNAVVDVWNRRADHE